MRILITGGAGYIGSHVVKEMLQHGYQVYVLDNLSAGHRKAVDPRADLIVGATYDYELLKKIFQAYHIDAVMHFAAHIEVAESMVDPAKYYQNNFSNSVSLMKAMRDSDVFKFVFSSTAAVYGNPQKIPIEENSPLQPINPYGRSKMMTEIAIEDFAKAYGIGYTILRYFNVAGAHPDGSIGEDHRPESHLIPRILAAGLDPKYQIKVYGNDYPTFDGTCIRDYIHVMDLAHAHYLALEATVPGHGHVYNVGSEKGFSVLEVVAACERVLGRPLSVKIEVRRPGDPPVLVASSEKIRRALDWEPEFPDIETIVRHAWRWHSSHPRGYASEALQPSSVKTAPL